MDKVAIVVVKVKVINHMVFNLLIQVAKHYKEKAMST